MESDIRYYYAVISEETNICTSVIDTFIEISKTNYISIDDYDPSFIGKKYEDGLFINSNLEEVGQEFIIINGLKIGLNVEFREFLNLAIESNKDDINVLTYDKVYVKLSNAELIHIREKIEDYDTSDKTNIIYF